MHSCHVILNKLKSHLEFSEANSLIHISVHPVTGYLCCLLCLFLSCPFSYLRLYGRKFSKEDHVLFIQLLYELVTLPHLEVSMMLSFARPLISLLK